MAENNKKPEETNTKPSTSAEDDSDGASASTSGDEQSGSDSTVYYAVALPRDVLQEYGLFIFYDRAAALDTVRNYRGIVREFRNINEAADFAAEPLEPKKKVQKKKKRSKKGKGTKRKLKKVKSDYLPSNYFGPDLEIIDEDSESEEDEEMELLSNCMEEDETFEDFVENDPHMVGHEEDAIEEHTGSVDVEQNAGDLEEENKAKDPATDKENA